MLLTNKLNRMLMKERRDISTYLKEVMDMKNKLKAFGEIIANKIFINIIVKGMLQSYKMMIQGITYIN
uniref:Uncharacterized protein n=1 Tax=Physcomitrium patens TaxID=3218 RepID=A0A2K1K1Y2_PHYPA|nr:hypothetical protein PHYPA_012253 [Physcomitrium patens]